MSPTFPVFNNNYSITLFHYLENQVIHIIFFYQGWHTTAENISHMMSRSLENFLFWLSCMKGKKHTRFMRALVWLLFHQIRIYFLLAMMCFLFPPSILQIVCGLKANDTDFYLQEIWLLYTTLDTCFATTCCWENGFSKLYIRERLPLWYLVRNNKYKEKTVS